MHFEHPAVLEVAVTAKRDEKNLVKPKAWVVLKEGIAESPELVKEIQQWVMDRTAKYKYPRWVVFVKELPKSATGKIQRFQLRDSFPMNLKPYPPWWGRRGPLSAAPPPGFQRDSAKGI